MLHWNIRTSVRKRLVRRGPIPPWSSQRATAGTTLGDLLRMDDYGWRTRMERTSAPSASVEVKNAITSLPEMVSRPT